jgi:hypothetical protein
VREQQDRLRANERGPLLDAWTLTRWEELLHEGELQEQGQLDRLPTEHGFLGGLPDVVPVGLHNARPDE